MELVGCNTSEQYNTVFTRRVLVNTSIASFITHNRLETAMSTPYSAVAKFPYTPSEENAADDLAFQIGQHITVTEIVDDDWLFGTYKDSITEEIKSGYFPRGFVEETSHKDEEEPADATTAAAEQEEEESTPEPEPEPVVAKSLQTPSKTTSAPAPIPGSAPYSPTLNRKAESTAFKNKISSFNVQSSVPLPGATSSEKHYNTKASPHSSYVPPPIGKSPYDTKKAFGGAVTATPQQGEVISERTHVEQEEEQAPRMTLKERMKILEQTQKEEQEALELALKRKQEKKEARKVAKTHSEIGGASPQPPLPTVVTGGSLTSKKSVATSIDTMNSEEDGGDAERSIQSIPPPVRAILQPTEEIEDEESEEQDDDNGDDDDDDDDDGDDDDDEEEDDEEVKRRRLRERMAKLSGGMGMMGMMGMPFPGAAPAAPKTEKKKKVKKSKTFDSESEKPAPVIAVALPGFSTVPPPGIAPGTEVTSKEEGQFLDTTEAAAPVLDKDIDEEDEVEDEATIPTDGEDDDTTHHPYRSIPKSSTLHAPPLFSNAEEDADIESAIEDAQREAARRISEYPPPNPCITSFRSSADEELVQHEPQQYHDNQDDDSSEEEVVTGYEADEDTDAAQPPIPATAPMIPLQQPRTIPPAPQLVAAPPPPIPRSRTGGSISSLPSSGPPPIPSHSTTTPVKTAPPPIPTATTPTKNIQPPPPPPPPTSTLPPVPRASTTSTITESTPIVPERRVPKSATHHHAPPPPPPSVTVPTSSTPSSPTEYATMASPPPVPPQQPILTSNTGSTMISNTGSSIVSNEGRRSLEYTLELSNSGSEVATGGWWLSHDLPPQLSTSKDVHYEIDSHELKKRGGRVVKYMDYYIVNQDYSYRLWELSFDLSNPNTLLTFHETQIEKPVVIQDYLIECSRRYGSIAFQVSSSLLGSTAKIHENLISWTFKQLPADALTKIGSKTYGATIYKNNSNLEILQTDEFRPGDILVVLKGKFESHGSGPFHKNKSIELGFGGKPYVAVIGGFDHQKKKIRAIEQNSKTNEIQANGYKLGDFKSGKIRVFRIVGRDFLGW